MLGIGAGALIAEQALVADGIPPTTAPGGRGQVRAPRTRRLCPRRHRGPGRGRAPRCGGAARQPVPPEPGAEHHLPALPRPRTDAPLVPPELRRAITSRTARRLGEARLADPRPHDRPPAVRSRAHLRQHRRRRREEPRPVPGQPARRVPGPGFEPRFPPRLPVRVPRGLLRHPGAGQGDLGAVLHDPQVPGRDDRPVPAGRRRPGPRRGEEAGRLGRLADTQALVRPDADDPADRVRRVAGGAGQPVHDHRPGAVPGRRAALLPRHRPRPAGRRDGQPARPAGERDHAEDHRLPPDVGGDRQRQVPRHRQELLGHRDRPPRVRDRRRRQLRALPAARHRGRPAVELHLRELRQLQHAEADQAAPLPRAGPHRPDRLLRAHAAQPDAGGAGSGLAARLQLLLHRPVGRRGQAPAAQLLPPGQPGRLRHRLGHLHLRHRHRRWKPRPSSPTPSTAATRTACTSTCTSRPR